MASMEGFIYFLLGIFVLFGLCVVTVLLKWMRSNRLVVRIPTSGNSIIDGYYWMNKVKDKQDGSVWWKSVFWQKKVKLQEPPSRCMDVNRRGKSWVEVYRISEDEYVFCKDSGLNAEVIMEGTGKKMSETFKPFSVVERETIINQYKKANADKPTDRVQQIIQLAPMLLMGMIIMISIIYFGEIAQGINSIQGGAGSMVEKASRLYGETVGGAKSLTADVKGGVSKSGESPPR